MSPASSDKQLPDGLTAPKPRMDVYTTMLILSVISLIIAITVLCLELNKYEWEMKPPI